MLIVSIIAITPERAVEEFQKQNSVLDEIDRCQERLRYSLCKIHKIQEFIDGPPGEQTFKILI